MKQVIRGLCGGGGGGGGKDFPILLD